MPSLRCLLAVSALFTVVEIANAGGGLPPRYAVTVLDALFDGATSGTSINDAGQSTGDSGVALVSIGTHAFLGQADGSIENIETLKGFDLSAGQVVNNRAQVAGTVTVFAGQSGVTTLFRYTPGVGMVHLGSLGGDVCTVIDMNDQGTIIGQAEDADGVMRGFMYTDAGGLQRLDDVMGEMAFPTDINNVGEISGYFWSGAFVRPFLWDGAFHDLGTLGGPNGAAYYLNDSAVVVGATGTQMGYSVAFRYTAEKGMEALPSPPHMGAPEAIWVNATGAITGVWWQESHQRAFYYTDADGMIDLAAGLEHTFTIPIAMNAAGETIILQLNEQTYETSGLVYAPASGVHDLDDCLATGVPWNISDVVDINESGQILVTACQALECGTLLLTPVTPGDLNGDGAIDQSDLGTLLAHYGIPVGATYAQGDINGDGAVDQSDLGVLLSGYGS